MVQLPAPFSLIPRQRLLYNRPSDIERLKRLTTYLALGSKDNDNSPTFWIKHEDSNSSLAYGGNKVRKLEYIAPDVFAKGADTLVTVGGIQSNHMRQVAAVGARLGLKVSAFDGQFD